MKNSDDPLKSNANHSLFLALLQLKTIPECEAFFRDLCTPAEIKAMSDRFLVAKFLNEGQLSYREINEKTGVSLATITRVARFLTQENYQGYQLVLKRIKQMETLNES